MLNWFALVSDDVAREQILWDYRHRMLIATEAGATYEEIARHVKLDVTRVGTMCVQAKYERMKGRTSPAWKQVISAHCACLTPEQFRERLYDVKKRREDAIGEMRKRAREARQRQREAEEKQRQEAEAEAEKRRKRIEEEQARSRMIQEQREASMRAALELSKQVFGHTDAQLDQMRRQSSLYWQERGKRRPRGL